MLANREPTLAAFFGAVEQHIRDGITLLPPRSEPGQRLIPDRFPGLQRSHLPQSNPAPHGHWHRPPCCLLHRPSKPIASRMTQTAANEGSGAQ